MSFGQGLHRPTDAFGAAAIGLGDFRNVLDGKDNVLCELQLLVEDSAIWLDVRGIPF